MNYYPQGKEEVSVLPGGLNEIEGISRGGNTYWKPLKSRSAPVLLGRSLRRLYRLLHCDQFIVSFHVHQALKMILKCQIPQSCHLNHHKTSLEKLGQ